MKYILIMWIWGNGAAIHHIDFDRAEDCLAAQKAVVTPSSWSSNDMVGGARCVQAVRAPSP